MRVNLLLSGAVLFVGAGLSATASPVCASTPTTTSNCDFLITIGSTGEARVMQVPGSSPFNSAVTFSDGSSDAGGDGLLIGVIDDIRSRLPAVR